MYIVYWIIYTILILLRVDQPYKAVDWPYKATVVYKIYTTVCCGISLMLNKNTWDVKKCEANIANRQVQPKGWISAEAKKLLYQNIFNSLNDTQYYSIFSQV